MADLSVIVVNYNSGWFLTNLVDSLMDQVFTDPHGAPGTLEIIVVDNDSPKDQRSWLEPLEARGIKVIYSKENTGYGGGNNLGMRHVNSDWVMIINPDVVILPGSLQKMLDVLYNDPQVGMVGPQGYLDPAMHFLLPPMGRKSLYTHLYETAGRFFKPLGRTFSMNRSRYAARHWFGPDQIQTDAISGYCFIMPSIL
ncbi:MAG: glycosyltransferase, partial [Planctomycetes bacterium]|nr:glycosyltransferase [Planctomycetota bacterium]